MAHVILSITLSLLLSSPNNAPERSFSQAVARSEMQRLRAAHTFGQRVTYRTYSNARYAFTVAYPVGILIPQGESDNGDGQKFVSRNGSAVLTAYGSNRLDRSLSDEFQSALANRTVTYKVLGKNSFVVSGTDGGKIFYQKTLMRGDVFKTFIIEYDEAERATFDPITSRIARSFVG